MGMLWMIRCRHAFLSMDNIDSDVQNRQFIKTTGKEIYITYTFYFTISIE